MCSSPIFSLGDLVEAVSAEAVAGIAANKPKTTTIRYSLTSLSNAIASNTGDTPTKAFCQLVAGSAMSWATFLLVAAVYMSAADAMVPCDVLVKGHGLSSTRMRFVCRHVSCPWLVKRACEATVGLLL